MEDKSNLYILGIVGLVAVIGIIVMIAGSFNHNDNYGFTGLSVLSTASAETLSQAITVGRNTTCTGSSIKSCSIANGVGKQYRICSSRKWSAWSSCIAVSCNSGYVIVSNKCVVAKNCSSGYVNCGNVCYAGSQSCAIANGVGTRTGYCAGTAWLRNTCIVKTCNVGYARVGNSCVSNATTRQICSDSDGGMYPYVYGNVIVSNPMNSQLVPYKADTCYSKTTVTHGASCNGTGCQVMENYCIDANGDGIKDTYNSYYADCPNGCSNGACVQTTNLNCSNYRYSNCPSYCSRVCSSGCSPVLGSACIDVCDGPGSCKNPEDTDVCCESFGYGANMIKTLSTYTMMPKSKCAVCISDPNTGLDKCIVGGGRNIVDNSYCNVSKCIAIQCIAPTVVGCFYRNQTYDSKGCMTSCGQLVCNVTPTCTDSDNTPNIYNVYIGSSDIIASRYPSFYTKGNGTGIYVGSSNNVIYGVEPNPSASKPSPYNYSIYHDHCVTATQLNEAFCANGKLSAYSVQCPNGCSNGACVQTTNLNCSNYRYSNCPSYCSKVCSSSYCNATPGVACIDYCDGPGSCKPQTSSCTDSDGGINYNVRGTLTATTTQGTKTDYCIGGSTPNRLAEYYCSGSTGTMTYYNCPYGCSNGACLNSSCVGTSVQYCAIANGVGTQSRTCNSGVWSSWGSCCATSCNSGYSLSGCSCVASTCSGSSIQYCAIANGVGQQIRVCNDKTWSAWGTCTVNYCNTGYIKSGNSCIIAPTCTNECTSGSRQCSDTYHYRVCGNYDSDTCLDWSGVVSCPVGYTCSAGICVDGACRNDCSSLGSIICAGGSTGGSTLIYICGNYDSDPCLDWSPVTQCLNETCIYSCLYNV